MLHFANERAIDPMSISSTASTPADRCRAGRSPGRVGASRSDTPQPCAGRPGWDYSAGMDQAVGAAAGTDTMAFRLVDADRRLAGVRLVQHAGLPAGLLDYAYDATGGCWRLTLPRPPV